MIINRAIVYCDKCYLPSSTIFNVKTEDYDKNNHAGQTIRETVNRKEGYLTNLCSLCKKEYDLILEIKTNSEKLLFRESLDHFGIYLYWCEQNKEIIDQFFLGTEYYLIPNNISSSKAEILYLRRKILTKDKYCLQIDFYHQDRCMYIDLINIITNKNMLRTCNPELEYFKHSDLQSIFSALKDNIDRLNGFIFLDYPNWREKI